MKKIMSICLTLAFCLIASAGIFASYANAAVAKSTGVYLGSDTVYYANGDIDYEIRGYVYHNGNTSSYLDVSSMAMFVTNYGVYPVNEFLFEAYDGEAVHHDSTWGYIDDLMDGDSRRLEADWEEICESSDSSTVYDKIGNLECACTNMVCGYRYGGLGGWLSFWYTDDREDDFHF